MCTSPQFDHDLFRILLYRSDATELLVEKTPAGFRLPALAIPRYTRAAAALRDAIKESWDLETYCLFTLQQGPASEDGMRNVVLESDRHDPPPPGMHWLPVVSCSSAYFEDLSEFAAIENSLATLHQHRRDEVPGCFGKPGWLPIVIEWVKAHASAAGLSLSGEFRQLNASPTFSLIRFETDGPALWFKAVGEPNLHEYSVTLKLATLFPEFVPQILGSQPEWNAWLALESQGCRLDANSTPQAWSAAAESLALIQIASLGRRFELIHAGCKDLRLCALVDLVDPFLDAMTELMERQAKLSPAPVSRNELRSLGRDITSTLQELGEAAPPNTLGHLDISPGNILVSRTRCIFLDWAEAYVGPPFLSFQYFLEMRRRLCRGDSCQKEQLTEAYATQWYRLASPEEIATALRLAPLLAVFSYAAGSGTWRNRESIRPETAGYLRSLARRMKREADALRERRPTCVP